MIFNEGSLVYDKEFTDLRDEIFKYAHIGIVINILDSQDRELEG